MIHLIKKRFKPKTDLSQLIKNGAVIIDVRTPAEYQAGHILVSQNIPLDTISKQAERLKKLNKPFITVCRTGNRSGMAKHTLEKAGIEVYNGGSWLTLKKQIK